MLILNKNVIKGDRMLDYIENVLGLKASLKKWNDQKKLPIYLQSNREYYKMDICGAKCLVIKLSADEFSLSSFQKQILQLKKYAEEPIVLWFDNITAYQRQALVQNKISFIVPGSQLYVPLMGMCFREYFQTKTLKIEKLTAMSQYILLYMIYDENNIYYSQVELAAKLGISAMNVSRSIQELEELNLIEVEKKGRGKVVNKVSTGKNLYESAKEYLQTPVQNRVYIIKEKPFMEFAVAGEEALAKKTMLNHPNHLVRAIDKKNFSIIAKDEIVDPNWMPESEYIELELWKYNPNIFKKDEIVDVISLALSLQDSGDERIEAQIDEMLEEHLW